MLQGMRKHAKYFYVLFVVVILSFIFWGVGGVDQNEAVYVAEVGDEKISLSGYWRAYDRVSDIYREVYGEEFDEERREALKEQVLNTMIEDILLLEAAVEAGISVSNGELEEAITSDSTFTREGVFNSDIYERTLELNRMTPAYFESVKRRELLLTKMKRLIEASVDLSPSELKGLKGEEKLVEALKEALLEAKRKAAVWSYVEGLKGSVEIKVNRDLIS
jgi:peptidyl-prolyl cis-trans isomerase D